VKRGLEVHVTGFREHEHGPQAVAKLMPEARFEPGGGAQAVQRHEQLHQVADIAHKTLRQLRPGPRPAAVLRLEFGVAFTHLAGAGGEGGEGHGPRACAASAGLQRGILGSLSFTAKVAKRAKG